MRKLTTAAVLLALVSTADALEWRAAYDALLGRETAEEPTPVFEAKSAEDVYRVTGYGAAPSSVANPAQARLMAIGAAELDAQRRLSALLAGRSVSAESESADFVQQRGVVSQSTRAFIKGARVIGTRYSSEGIAEVDLELVPAASGRTADFASLEGYQIRPAIQVAVTQTMVRRPRKQIAVPVPVAPAAKRTKRPESAATPAPVVRPVAESTRDRRPPVVADVKPAEPVKPAPAAPLQPQQEARAAEEAPSLASEEPRTRIAQADISDPSWQPAPKAEPRQEPVPAPEPDKKVDYSKVKGPYTDLVLDARGAGAVRALRPKVFTASGAQLYPFKGSIIEKEVPDFDPKIRYVASLGEAERIAGFGPKPLIIKVKGVRGAAKADLVLPNTALFDLAELRDSRMAQGDGNVVVVID